MLDLQRQGIETSQLETLELFGGTGKHHLVDYVRYVKHVTAWEILPDRAAKCERNLADWGVTVKVGDTYHMIREEKSRYDLVVCDAPIVPDEHFRFSLLGASSESSRIKLS